jgi:hypothetical protein
MGVSESKAFCTHNQMYRRKPADTRGAVLALAFPSCAMRFLASDIMTKLVAQSSRVVTAAKGADRVWTQQIRHRGHEVEFSRGTFLVMLRSSPKLRHEKHVCITNSQGTC